MPEGVAQDKETVAETTATYREITRYLPTVLVVLNVFIQYQIAQSVHLKIVISNSIVEELQTQYPQLKTAVVKARLADEKESHHNYRAALELYKDSVSLLLPLIDGKVCSTPHTQPFSVCHCPHSEVPSREQKKLIRSEVYCIKLYILQVIS